jgi:hypothetical protein
VKGRVSGAPTITVTRNEILYSLNKPDDFILAIVEFTGEDTHQAHYLRQPFQREPDFGVTSVNYDFAELLAQSCVESAGILDLGGRSLAIANLSNKRKDQLVCKKRRSRSAGILLIRACIR